MNIEHLTSAALAAVIFFTSCESGTVEQEKSCPLLIAGRIYDYGQSDADRLSHSEHIGVFVFDSETDDALFSNLGYTATYGTKDDYFQPDNTGSIPHFAPDGDERWNVAAYFPYDETSDGHVKLSVADQTKITGKTLLLYACAKGVEKTGRTAYLRLSPALSRIVFRFHAGEGVAADVVKGIASTLADIPAVGNFSVLTSHFTLAEDSGAAVDMLVADAPADGALCETAAYVIPQADVKGYMAHITVPGEAEPRTLDIGREVVNFDRGTEYVYEITVNRETLDVKVSSAPIAGWTEDGSLELDDEQEM